MGNAAGKPVSVGPSLEVAEGSPESLAFSGCDGNANIVDDVGVQ